MLVARSSPECRLYLELHPHECGEHAFPVRSTVVRSDAGLLAVYDGTCPRCGKARRVEFSLDSEIPPPPPAFGGAAPSRLLDPGQFLFAADEAARQCPDVLTGLSTQRARYVYAKLGEAAAAIEEVLKFVPAGASAIPASAFSSQRGRDVYMQEPGRFDVDRLRAVLATYQEGLRAYARELAKLEPGPAKASAKP
jgi:hypothetical protein